MLRVEIRRFVEAHRHLADKGAAMSSLIHLKDIYENEAPSELLMFYKKIIEN